VPDGETGQADASAGAAGGMEETGETTASAASQSSPGGILRQGLIVLLLTLAATAALELAGIGGPLIAWSLYAGGVAAIGPGYTILRYFEFLMDDAGAGALSAVPGVIEAAAVGGFILAGAAWLYRRTRRAIATRTGRSGRSGASATAGKASIAEQISSELAHGIAMTGSRIGFVGRFSPGAAPRDLKILAMRDGSLESGGQSARGQARVTPEQLAILLDHQELDTHPIFANGPRDQAIQRWLPNPLPEIKAMLAVPISDGGEPVGLLGLANSPHRYDDAAAAKVASVAESLAALITAGDASGENSDTTSKKRRRKKPAKKKSEKKKSAKRKTRDGGETGRPRRKGTATWRIPGGRS
jgi:hypothetical protein